MGTALNNEIIESKKLNLQQKLVREIQKQEQEPQVQ